MDKLGASLKPKDFDIDSLPPFKKNFYHVSYQCLSTSHRSIQQCQKELKLKWTRSESKTKSKLLVKNLPILSLPLKKLHFQNTCLSN